MNLNACEERREQKGLLRRGPIAFIASRVGRRHATLYYLLTWSGGRTSLKCQREQSRGGPNPPSAPFSNCRQTAAENTPRRRLRSRCQQRSADNFRCLAVSH